MAGGWRAGAGVAESAASCVQKGIQELLRAGAPPDAVDHLQPMVPFSRIKADGSSPHSEVTSREA